MVKYIQNLKLWVKIRTPWFGLKATPCLFYFQGTNKNSKGLKQGEEELKALSALCHHTDAGCDTPHPLLI
jgi:hypothetical protein